jgi:hypothetical protein
MGAAPLAGSLAHTFAELITQVRLVHKAAVRRDSPKRILAHQQKLLSTLDTPSDYVLMGRTTKTLFEYPIEAIGTELHHSNELRHLDGGMQMRGNIHLDRTRLPRCHDTALPQNRLLFGMARDRGSGLSKCHGGEASHARGGLTNWTKVLGPKNLYQRTGASGIARGCPSRTTRRKCWSRIQNKIGSSQLRRLRVGGPGIVIGPVATG